MGQSATVTQTGGNQQGKLQKRVANHYQGTCLQLCTGARPCTSTDLLGTATLNPPFRKEQTEQKSSWVVLQHTLC